jgi:flagellar biosynthesis/type III secretory pathway M-ring protein FliF/YscJ
MVAQEYAMAARATLMEQRIAPLQTASFVERLVETRSWMNSRQDNHQQFWANYSEHLSEILSLWQSLSRADVAITMPEPGGLGRTHLKPTATVSVWPVGGQLSQDAVDAIAIGVAGGVPGLEPTGVSIVDGVSMMAYYASDHTRLSARRSLEHQAQVEAMIEDKIRGFLRDIPGMSLGVFARVDGTRRSQQSQQYDRPVSAISSESRTEQSQQNTSQGGVGGTRSNEPRSVSEGSADGSSFTESTEDSTFESRFPTTTESVEDPGGTLLGVSVMLGVPRSHVLRLIELESAPPADDADPVAPTPQEIADRFDRVRSDLEARIQVALGNIVTGDPADVAVTVSMLSDVTLVGNSATGVGFGGGSGGGEGGGGGFMGLAGGGLIDKAVLGVLALVSVAMMAMLMRKATRKVDLPTAEELVGIPPALKGDGDVFGEADEGDVPMSGIELDEEQVRAGKMLDQVADLVTSSPETAASLLQSWVAADQD